MRLVDRKPTMGGIAASTAIYPAYNPATVSGSAAITGHSVRGDSRIALARATILFTSTLKTPCGLMDVVISLTRCHLQRNRATARLCPWTSRFAVRYSTLRAVDYKLLFNMNFYPGTPAVGSRLLR